MTCAFPKPGDRFADQYYIVREIGRGGFARVFLGIQEKLDRPVAIKVIDPDAIASTTAGGGDDPDRTPRTTHEAQYQRGELIARFKLEARLVSQLHSPHTVTLHDFGHSDDGLLFMVMEYVDGVGFDRLETPMAANRVIDVMKQALSGLSEAHRAGILHRDLKPANLMLFDHGELSDQVKLLDFGVAKLLDSRNPAKPGNLTRQDVAIGTPRYMAPEQVMGAALDARCDIYGFGLVVYELLAGRQAIAITDPIQILTAQVRGDSFALPDDVDVPDGLRRVVDKMLQKDRSRRYISADAVIRDLDRLEVNGQDAARYRFGAGRGFRWIDMSPKLLGVGATIGFVAMLTALMVAGSGSEARSEQGPTSFDPPRIAGEPVDFTDYRLQQMAQRRSNHAALEAPTDLADANRIRTTRHTDTSVDTPRPEPTTKKRRHQKRRRNASKTRFEFVPIE